MDKCQQPQDFSFNSYDDYAIFVWIKSDCAGRNLTFSFITKTKNTAVFTIISSFYLQCHFCFFQTPVLYADAGVRQAEESDTATCNELCFNSILGWYYYYYYNSVEKKIIIKKNPLMCFPPCREENQQRGIWEETVPALYVNKQEGTISFKAIEDA